LLVFEKLCQTKSKGCLEKAKPIKRMPQAKALERLLSLASFYSLHIDGNVCVKQIGLGSARQGH
jgi:hypothetical protein